MMQLYYQSSKNEQIDLMSDGIYAQNPESLASHFWKYSELTRGNHSRIKHLYKEVTESTLTLSVMCRDKEEYGALMERLHRVLDVDVRTEQPGRIYWNEYYIKAYAVGVEYSDYEEYFDSVEIAVTFATDSPFWTHETVFMLGATESTTAELDYPFDFSFDYDDSVSNLSIDNKSLCPSDFKMVFYGPYNRPNITIGSNLYLLNTSLLSGERAVIDSAERTIVKYALDGTIQNIFSERDRDNYIFEPIEIGTLAIDKPYDLQAEVTLLDERSEPLWT